MAGITGQILAVEIRWSTTLSLWGVRKNMEHKYLFPMEALHPAVDKPLHIWVIADSPEQAILWGKLTQHIPRDDKEYANWWQENTLAKAYKHTDGRYTSIPPDGSSKARGWYFDHVIGEEK